MKESTLWLLPTSRYYVPTHARLHYLRYICVCLSVFACSTYIELWACFRGVCGCRIEVEFVINVLFGADGAGPGKLYGPRGPRLIAVVSLELLCLWMTNCNLHSGEKHTHTHKNDLISTVPNVNDWVQVRNLSVKPLNKQVYHKMGGEWKERRTNWQNNKTGRDRSLQLLINSQRDWEASEWLWEKVMSVFSFSLPGI